MVTRNTYNSITVVPVIARKLYLITGFALLIAMGITSQGCRSYDKELAWVNSHYPPAEIAYNPSFVFDVPHNPAAGVSYYRADNFVHPNWPVSNAARKVTTTFEISTYNEYTYDDQYISADNKPRQYVHYRLRTHRISQSVR